MHSLSRVHELANISDELLRETSPQRHTPRVWGIWFIADVYSAICHLGQVRIKFFWGYVKIICLRNPKPIVSSLLLEGFGCVNMHAFWNVSYEQRTSNRFWWVAATFTIFANLLIASAINQPLLLFNFPLLRIGWMINKKSITLRNIRDGFVGKSFIMFFLLTMDQTRRLERFAEISIMDSNFNEPFTMIDHDIDFAPTSKHLIKSHWQTTAVICERTIDYFKPQPFCLPWAGFRPNSSNCPECYNRRKLFR